MSLFMAPRRIIIIRSRYIFYLCIHIIQHFHQFVKYYFVLLPKKFLIWVIFGFYPRYSETLAQ